MKQLSVPRGSPPTAPGPPVRDGHRHESPTPDVTHRAADPSENLSAAHRPSRTGAQPSAASSVAEERPSRNCHPSRNPGRSAPGSGSRMNSSSFDSVRGTRGGQLTGPGTGGHTIAASAMTVPGRWRSVVPDPLPPHTCTTRWPMTIVVQRTSGTPSLASDAATNVAIRSPWSPTAAVAARRTRNASGGRRSSAMTRRSASVVTNRSERTYSSTMAVLVAQVATFS